MACTGASGAYAALTALTVADITYPLNPSFTGELSHSINLSDLVSGNDHSCDTTCSLLQITDVPK